MHVLFIQIFTIERSCWICVRAMCWSEPGYMLCILIQGLQLNILQYIVILQEAFSNVLI